MSVLEQKYATSLEFREGGVGKRVSPNYFLKYCKNFIALKCVAQTGLCDMFCEHMFDHGVFGFLAEEIYQT